ncbi:MAG TPA: rhomboid family intramembrane serine protease [Chloroflexota bacterium]|nr:rhomboid family intramembrane serine protease [Chloroflexota bacterium]
MLPIGDSPKTARLAVVNLSLIALNILAFLYELTLGSHLESFIEQWGVIPARTSAILAGVPGSHPAGLVTLVTAMFLHGGWLHIGGNMLFLWIFGDNVEDRLGRGTYLAFYFACGIAANLAQVYADPTSTVAAIGASGAIAGVLGAYLITFPGARVSVLFPILFFFWVLEIPALIVIGFWFLTQLFSGVAALASTTAQAEGIAWWAHVGGFVCGVALMVVLPKSRTARPGSWPANVKDRAREDTGLVGLTFGLVSLLSHATQLILIARLVIVFLGARPLARAIPLVRELLVYTEPFLRPIALFVPSFRLDGRVVELPTLVAIAAVYLLGVAITSIIANFAYGPGRPRIAA